MIGILNLVYGKGKFHKLRYQFIVAHTFSLLKFKAHSAISISEDVTLSLK